MKKMKILFQRIFPRPAKQESVFSNALSEAFLDFFKEMGYKMSNKK
jgi:hypothetical protein